MAVRSCSAILHEAKTQMNLKNAVNVHLGSSPSAFLGPMMHKSAVGGRQQRAN